MRNLTMHPPQLRLHFTAWLTALAIVLPAAAYESYHNPSTPGTGNCATCHPGFVGGPSLPLHALHTGGTDPITSNCNLCHTGPTRDNPLTMWSGGTGGGNLGCMGCHGLDYGETIQANYRTFNTAGLHKQSGYGLRRHHARVGIAICATCHTNDVNVAPYGENVVNTGLGFTTHYYTRADVRIRGAAANPCNNEDTLNDADSRGLDNDGDGVYDADDPDCTGAPVTVSFTTTSTNTIISWPFTYDGWHVQVSTNLGSSWNDLPNVPRETNSTWTVVLTPSQGTRFFRLNKRL
jgi:hypothetical protein